MFVINSLSSSTQSPGRNWHKLATITSLGLLLGAGGCVSTKTTDPAVAEEPLVVIDEAPVQAPMEDLVAKDLVFVFRQLAHPASTTVQFLPDDTTFQKQLVEELIIEGYGVQRVQADLGANFLSYDIQSDSSSTPSYTYTLSIGDIQLTRNYVIDNGGSLFPASPITLAGSRIPAKLDRSLFSHLGQTSVAIDNIRFSSATPIDSSIPTISLITSDVVSGAAKRLTGAPVEQALNSSNVEINNLFFGDASNFESVLDGYSRHSRDIIPFGDDQLRMGRFGKRMVITVLTSYNEATDLISVIGCSNGPTSAKIGNVGLALGRAARVTEELLSHGVARDQILDEGCWAPQSAGDRFPSRGVLVELWRRDAP